MAQERYGFFNSTAEDGRSYDSADMATALGALASSGVAAAGGCLQVTAEGSTMRTLVGYGTALIRGYYYQLKDDGSGVRAFTHTVETELNRMDRIILRLDLTARTISLAKLIGTPGASPVPPELTRSDEVYELSLACVHIGAGAAALTAENIADERENDAVCGLIAPESLRRSAVQQLIGDAIAPQVADVLRYAAQTLETSQKDQARANINAQQRITATGILKGDGSGGVTPAAANADYALPCAAVSATLSAAAWSGTAAPYTQYVTIPGLAVTTNAIVGLSWTSGAQYLAAAKAKLRVTAQGTNAIGVTAEGKKPTVDLPLSVMMMG